MKKILIGLLTLVFMISGICFFGTDSGEVLAAAGDVTTGDGYIAVEYNDLTTYRKAEGNVAPTAPTGYEDYIFAGWYQDNACGTAYANVTADTTLAYAKFVPANVLSVKVQLKSDATSTSEATNMRLVSSVDSLRYKNVGYKIYFNGATEPVPVETNTVYKRVVASTESGVDYNYSPKVVDVESEYFVTATLLNIKNTEEKPNFDKPFYIKPYWTTLDGTVVYGVSKYVTVNNGLSKTNINIPIKVSTDLVDESLSVTVGGNKPTSAEVAHYDGTYAHLNIDVTNRDTVLKSLSMITVTDGTTSGTAEYRNLMTKYSGDNTEDISWYDVYGTEAGKYVIATSADLYGLAKLVNTTTYDFSSQTIYAIADIEVNKGRATERGWDKTQTIDGTTIADGTEYVWTPIGYTTSFLGIFDGQDHKISGLNGTPTTTASEAYLGLFGLVGWNTEIKNFRLENSYFEERTTGTNYTGSIVGRMNGNIDSVYSDAFVKGYTILTGGIVGRTHSTSNKTISNCWYSGTLILDGDSATYGGGIVGQQFQGTLTMRDCLFSGDIKFMNRTINEEVYVGGLCGRSETSMTIKNSLCTGEISMGDSTATLTAMGHVIGLLKNGTAPVEALNLYYVGKSSSVTATVGGNAGQVSGDITPVNEVDITGNCAYFNNILDYSDTGAWALVPTNSETGVVESTPVLKTFADIVGVEPALPEVVGNIDWYTGLDETSFAICNNEDNAANVEELKGFAYLVNEGISFSGKKVTMNKSVTVNEGTVDKWDTANGTGLDPWTPIGGKDNEFAGTFDGQMNTIKGLYMKNTSTQGIGLFGSTSGESTVSNLKLEESYFYTNQSFAGSVVGNCSGNVICVYSNATVDAKKAYCGGIIGQVWNNTSEEDQRVKVSNCWFAGELKAGNSHMGGIVGLISNGYIQFENCLNSGTIGNTAGWTGGLIGRTWKTDVAMAGKWHEGVTMTQYLNIDISNCLNVGEMVDGTIGTVGSIIGRVQGDKFTVSNLYATNESYQNSSTLTPTGVGQNSMGIAYTLVSESNITGLRSHYNNILVGAEEWVPTETTPALKAFTDGLLTESTADINIDWFEGFGTTEYTICDEATNAENVAELNGFAYLVNHGIDFDGMTVTMASNVTVNEETISDLAEEELANLDKWTTIGTIEKPFAGIFNGGKHSISGLYATATSEGLGLFGATAEGSTVQDVKVVNSYFSSTAKYVGSIVGKSNGSLINIYSEASVHGIGFVGGLVGYICTTSTKDINYSNCWFAGELVTTGNQSGGIVGTIYGGTIEMTNCLNTGGINCGGTNKAFVGGICGGLVEETGYVVDIIMTSCLNAGKLTNCSTAEDSSVGAIYGRRNSGAAIEVINVYATNESYFKGVGYTNMPNGTVIMVDESDITGEMAFYNKVLVDDTINWALTTTTPVVANFVDEAKAMEAPTLDESIDIVWYSGLKSATHTVCNSDANAENVKQLYGFAYLVNQGVDFDDMTVNLGHSVTVNDSSYTTWNVGTAEGLKLWQPIGTATLGFAGTFDGNFNSISGIFVKTNEQGAGLFKYTTDESVIQNLKLVNSYIYSTSETTAIAGSIVGSCGGDLKNVYSNAFVRGLTQYVGGIAGQLYGAGNITVEGCWFAGTVAGTTTNAIKTYDAGGIVGVVSSGTITMTDCLNTGKVFITNDRAGGLIGVTYSGPDRWSLNGTTSTIKVTVNNCLCTGQVTGNGAIGSAIGWRWKGTLNLGTSVYATATSEETNKTGTSGKLIGTGTISNGGTVTEVATTDIIGSIAYYNLKGLDFTDTGKWVLLDGKAPQLKAFADEEGRLAVPETSTDVAWYNMTEDTYTIDTADELMGFSYLSNSGITFANKTVKLGANIDLNEGWTASNAEAPEVEWNPIGIENAPFAGIFDGQGKSISGVYVASSDKYIGLFGVIGESSEVKNLRLLNSYFEQQVTPEDDIVELDGYVGSIAGWLKGDMDNIYSNAVVKSGNRYTGGLVSWVRRTDLSKAVSITNCWYDGQIIAGTYGRYIGGIAAGILNGTCNMENVLFTGKIDACYNGGKALYLGGIVGEVKAIVEEFNLTSAVSAGQITGDHSGSVVHAVVGRVRTAVYDNKTEKANATEPKFTLKNVFATRDCCQTTYSVGDEVEGIKIVDGEEVTVTSKVVVTGGVLLTSGDDRLIGYGTQEVTNADGTALALDFTEAWSMRINGVPIPTSLVDMAEENTVLSSVDAAVLAKEIGLDYWNASASIKDAVAYGAGNYLVSYTPADGKSYAGYIDQLEKLGFTKYADNSGTDMATDGVVSGTYYKEATAGEWVLNITSVANESKIYISIGTDTKALDDNLKSATQEGSNAISLSMLEMVNTYGDDPDTNQDADPYGNSFVFQLPNGHFIVSDGGREEDGLKLIEFLKDQAGTGNDVIIDAWIVTHYHDDHCGALNMFFSDSSLRTGIYLEAVYACEPSAYALDYWEGQLGVMNKALRGAMTLTRKSDGARPAVYQLHMGQRYYFNGITMDVIDTQEQHPVATWGGTNPDAFPDEFNTSSTNCVFTFTDKAGTAKKVLIGGDATTINMEYIMDVYGKNNKTLKDIDVFAAYHHGHNMTATYGDMTVSAIYGGFPVEASANGEANKDWINFLLNNNDDNKFDAVLFSYNHIYRANLTFSGSFINGGRDYYYKGTDGNVVYPYNIGEINDYLASSTCTANAYTYENGTVKITFDGSNTTKVFGSGVFTE